MNSSFDSASGEPQAEAASRGSRRALLAGAMGGLGAFAAAALGRRDGVRASDPNDVVLGASNTATTPTTITNNANSLNVLLATSAGAGTGVWGTSMSGTGAAGVSTSGRGVFGISNSAEGVEGASHTGSGVFAETSGGNKAASVGWNLANQTGVLGYSGPAALPAAKPKTGVYGYANQDSQARGVWGHSPAGIGVYGQTSTGYAGYFFGKVFSTQFYELAEIATPGAPGANKARLFIRDNGSGKSQLCVRFATGSVKLLAAE